jgi:hypothetical protein
MTLRGARSLLLHARMGLHSLLERLGFVRLRDFGLILTADRRIVTTREVLDDGYGATVVGWEDSDLAATELKKRRATTGGSSVAFRPLPPPPAVPVPPPVPPMLGVAKKVTAPMPAPTMLPVVERAIPAPVTANVVFGSNQVFSNPDGSNPFLSNTVAYPGSPSVVPKPDASSDFAATIVAVPSFVTSVPSGDEDDFVKEDEWEWQIARARMQEDKTPTPVGAAPANPFAKEPRRATIHPAQSMHVVAAASTPRTIIPIPSLPAAVDSRRILDAYHPPRRMARGTSMRPEHDADTSTAIALRARR